MRLKKTVILIIMLSLLTNIYCKRQGEINKELIKENYNKEIKNNDTPINIDYKELTENFIISENAKIYESNEKDKIVAELSLFIPVRILERQTNLIKIEVLGKPLIGWIEEQDVNVLPDNWSSFNKLSGVEIFCPKKIEVYKIYKGENEYKLYDEKDGILINLMKIKGTFEEHIMEFIELEKRLGGNTQIYYLKMQNYKSGYYKYISVSELTYGYSMVIKISDDLYFDITIDTPVDRDEKRESIIKYYDTLAKKILFTAKIIK